MRRFLKFLLVILLFIPLGTVQATETKNPNQPLTKEMTVQEKRNLRRERLPLLIQKYESNQTFTQMHQYMLAKFNERNKKGTPSTPDKLIIETFQKTNNLFDKIRSFVGNNFTKQYDPVILEANFNKYLWLKGICFKFLGINEEHKIAVSFFYQQENDEIKRQFLLDVVKFSFPEVMDVPQNESWFTEMSLIMERIAYKAFNVDKYHQKSKQ
ncbi:MAG TPA: hypothetical protein PLZ08_03590 [Bacillota bacterium]|jgi:hypothetical protein|nr:hypothetical protein [Bacillota bacterium]HOL09199.1 hypothetical protein [Bacillota bacterium]HPO97023.1 hypothetical protein [Bacillota bacterium]